MERISLVILLLVVLPAMAFAGHGTIRETTDQIIVEYDGDTNEVIAYNTIKEREDKLKEQEEKHKADEAVRLQKFIDDQRKEKAERRTRRKEGDED